MGKFWDSLTEFWRDLKNALLVVVIIYVTTQLLVRIRPFNFTVSAHAKTSLQYLVIVLVVVSVGYTEEVVFRGLLLTQFRLLTRNLSAAVILQAILFSVCHGGNQSITQFLKHGISGCIFAFVAIRRNSLWPAVLAHGLLDFLAFTL